MSLRFLMSIFLLLFVASPALADTEAFPRSWMTPTDDGKSVFVMLAPKWMRSLEVTGDELNEVPAGYLSSGLYLQAEFSKPTYTVSWYARNVDISLDGRHLVRHGPWARSTDDLAVAFYEDGILLHEYAIDDLILFTNPNEHSVSHFLWLDERRFNSATGEVSISTLSWTHFQFDATTGEITSSFRGDYLLVGVFGAVVVMVIAWIVRRRRRHKRKE